MNKQTTKAYSWIVRGTQRKAIILVLTKPKTPKEISEETKLKFSNVSDVLRAMQEKGLVRCLNPEERMGRLYSLTKKGQALLKEFS